MSKPKGVYSYDFEGAIRGTLQVDADSPDKAIALIKFALESAIKSTKLKRKKEADICTLCDKESTELTRLSSTMIICPECYCEAKELTYND